MTELLEKKLIDLYFVQTKKYLIQTKGGNYLTLDTKRTSKNGKKTPPVSRWHIANHLKGKSTLGAYGGRFKSKFVCFDVDFKEQSMAKWITYKISDALSSHGIHEHYISFSGFKGYHIEIFLEDLILLEHAKRFFDFIIKESGVVDHFNDSSKVEFRVTDKQGLKVPLGLHQKTKKFCGFCRVEDGLKVMPRRKSYNYFLGIEKIKEAQILELIQEESSEESLSKDDSIRLEEALSHYDELKIYEPTEDDGIDKAIDLLNNGLKYPGSRHNALLLLAKYMLYCGMDREDCHERLKIWMTEQEPGTYTTPLKECYVDIDKVVQYTYDREYSIKIKPKTVEVTYDEIRFILKNCQENSQILLSYAFLVHGRFFSRKDGVFYFPYSLMQQATGLSEKTCRNQVEYISLIGVMEFVSRNQKQEKSHLKKANRYRLLLKIESEAKAEVNMNTKAKDVLGSLFTDKELRSEIGRKRFKSLIS